jgi:GAF domain-containing protein
MVEACSWLEPCSSKAEFAPTSCWALRRGGEHRSAGSLIDVPCEHLDSDGQNTPEGICLPLSAQSGTLGMLYFERRPSFADAEIPELLIKMLAENIGLALDNLQLRDALRDLAMADPLTRLANRRQLDAVLEDMLSAPAGPMSCVMIDIDHFKRFNDEHGHEAGDAVLRAVGETLRPSSEPNSFACGSQRYGSASKSANLVRSPFPPASPVPPTNARTRSCSRPQTQPCCARSAAAAIA